MPNQLKHIFEIMGLNKENGLCELGDELPDYPLRIKTSLKSVSYDAIYNVNNKPLIIFKYFKSQEDIENKIYNIHKDIWNFGETPILFIVLPHEIRIYNAFEFKKENNEAWKKISGNKSKLNEELDEFSYMNLISGKFWKDNENEFDKRTRVHNYLLGNLKSCRLKLDELGLPSNITNNLLARLIFSRYLLDRNILKKDFFKLNYDKSFIEIIKDKKSLYSYFNFLKKRFNGDLFQLDDIEFELVNYNHLNVISRLFNGDNIVTGQTVLFDIYDFSIIPIELVSSIYETFIHKKGLNSNGTYYTPLFLVDYILKNTLEKRLDDCELQCKILDPACGSGIFLVESLRKLIEKKKLDIKRELSTTELNELVQKSIFGIDLDENAIDISIFSIYLTILDYIKPSDMENFKFPELKHNNLFKADFFDTDHEFNKRVKNIDIIIGNPPWSKFEGTHVDYCKEKDIPTPNKEIALSFMTRSRDFTNENSNIALIVTSKLLYNLRDKSFREYFLNNFYLNEVLEFSAVRRKVFANAIGPGSIIFYKPAYGKNTSKNLVKYISLKQNRFFKLFKAIVIEKQDVKYIQQEFLLKYDWIWKVILYGNVNDFMLIKRLKEEFVTFEDLIKNKKTIIHGVGLQSTKSKNPQDASDLIGKKFLKTERLKRYSIEHENLKWTQTEVHRIRNKKLFEPPHILMRVSLNNKDYSTSAAFSEEELIFNHSVQAIKGEESDKDFLKALLGVLNSKFFSYYMFMTGSSIGIERPQVRSSELTSFPIVIDNSIIEKIDVLQNIYQNEQNSSNLKSKKELEQEIDNSIFDSYGFTDSERDLVDYTMDVIIPIRKGRDEPFDPPKKHHLKEYSEIFTNHFEKILNDEYLFTEIYDTGYFITMHFKNSQKKITEPKFIKDENFEQIDNILSEMSLSEFTKDLYILRDIKGFEKNSFYVIKPKEYKNWHKAVARSDLDEFLDAIMKSGLKNSYGDN